MFPENFDAAPLPPARTRICRPREAGVPAPQLIAAKRNEPGANNIAHTSLADLPLADLVSELRRRGEIQLAPEAAQPFTAATGDGVNNINPPANGQSAAAGDSLHSASGGVQTQDGPRAAEVPPSTATRDPKPDALRAQEDVFRGETQCPYGPPHPFIALSRKQEASSLSSDGNVSRKSTTTRASTPRSTPDAGRPDTTATRASETDGELAQVAESILQQRIPADDLLVHSIIHACRANEGTATTDEICHFIHVKGAIAKSKGHPGAYLRTAVSNCFTGASFAEFRKTRASISPTGPRVPSPSEADEQRATLIDAQEAEELAWELRQQRLKDHPEECIKCLGKGYYQSKEQRKLCDCPAGDRRRCHGERDCP